MINKSNFLITQVRAVTRVAINHHCEDNLRELLDELLSASSRVEHAIAWRKIHGGDAA